MARLPRLSLPGHLHHILQRGNNRQAIFSSPADYKALLDLVEEQAKKFSVAVHAYVLMDNHFQLLATPEAADALPRMMQAVGRRYVRHFNDAQGRSGTLWEGRYRSALIQAESWLLDCMVGMDLNPVRGGLAAEARDYPWSSHGHYIGLRSDRVITPHPLFWTLGNTPFAREVAYAEMVRAGVSPTRQSALTESVLGGWALGDPAYLADLQHRTERRVMKAHAGRPPKKSLTP